MGRPSPRRIRFNGATYQKVAGAPYDEIQTMVESNPYLKGTITANENTVTPVGDYYLLTDPAGLAHVRDRHVSEEGIGSKFNKGLDLHKAILSLMAKNTPNETGGGKVKWLAQDTGSVVGVDNVLKGDPKDVAKMQDFKISDRETVKVRQGQGTPTQHMSLIGGLLGKTQDGKSVVTVITAFPGKNGAEIADRNDLAKNGYYFVTPNLPKQASVPQTIRVNGVTYVLATETHPITNTQNLIYRGAVYRLVKANEETEFPEKWVLAAAVHDEFDHQGFNNAVTSLVLFADEGALKQWVYGATNGYSMEAMSREDLGSKTPGPVYAIIYKTPLHELAVEAETSPEQYKQLLQKLEKERTVQGESYGMQPWMLEEIGAESQSKTVHLFGR